MKHITASEYKKPLRYWKGRKVTVLVDMETSLIKISAGSVLTIVDKHSGFSLIGTKCPTCGVSVFIRKVPPQGLAEVELRENEGG